MAMLLTAIIQKVPGRLCKLMIQCCNCFFNVRLAGDFNLVMALIGVVPTNKIVDIPHIHGTRVRTESQDAATTPKLCVTRGMMSRFATPPSREIHKRIASESDSSVFLKFHKQDRGRLWLFNQGQLTETKR